mmetsp:Transcript_1043/g.2420  ORF Transcript_1043/g.2420 Transcript_1043/m.2420 type:complete len:234 (+) Transcript_1043:114-815(+)
MELCLRGILLAHVWILLCEEVEAQDEIVHKGLLSVHTLQVLREALLHAVETASEIGEVASVPIEELVQCSHELVLELGPFLHQEVEDLIFDLLDMRGQVPDLHRLEGRLWWRIRGLRCIVGRGRVSRGVRRRLGSIGGRVWSRFHGLLGGLLGGLGLLRLGFSPRQLGLLLLEKQGHLLLDRFVGRVATAARIDLDQAWQIWVWAEMAQDLVHLFLRDVEQVNALRQRTHGLL